MRKFKNKQILQVFIIISIVAISVILFFFPKAIDNKYKYSYENIREGKEQVTSLNDNLISNEISILTNMARLDQLKEERDGALREKSKIGINKSDFILDIPSILISLEQNAINNNVELSINYNAIVTNTNELQDGYSEETDSDVSPTTELEEDKNEDSKNDKSTEGNKDNSKQDKVTITEENSKDSKEGEESKETLVFSTPNIEGIDVTVIPISISGSYASVREYIKYLDEVGMIEPSSVTLESKGKTVTSSVMLNVFHGKED